jgi:hypothetical protein
MYDANAARESWEAKQAALALAAKQLQQQNRHLIPVGEKANSLVAAAKNIRIELGQAFRGCTFRVHSSRFSGGNSISIRWTDGPTTKQVDAIADRYSAGDFNGSDDSYSYRADRAWTAAFGDAKYVQTQREYSDAMIARAIGAVCARLGGMDNTPTVEDYRQGRLWNIRTSGNCDFSRELNIYLSESTQFPVAAAIDEAA